MSLSTIHMLFYSLTRFFNSIVFLFEFSNFLHVTYPLLFLFFFFLSFVLLPPFFFLFLLLYSLIVHPHLRPSLSFFLSLSFSFSHSLSLSSFIFDLLYFFHPSVCCSLLSRPSSCCSSLATASTPSVLPPFRPYTSLPTSLPTRFGSSLSFVAFPSLVLFLHVAPSHFPLSTLPLRPDLTSIVLGTMLTTIVAWLTFEYVVHGSG